MAAKEEKRRLEKLLSEAIPMLCKNGLTSRATFCVQAMIGITVDSGSADHNQSDDGDLILVCFKQTVSNNGQTVVTLPYGEKVAAASSATAAATDPKRQTADNRHVVAASEPTATPVKLEPTDIPTNEDVIYDVDDDGEEQEEEQDLQYIDDDEQYEGYEGEEGDYGEYQDDGSGEYYDPNYTGEDGTFKSEPLDGSEMYGSTSRFAAVKDEPSSFHSSSFQSPGRGGRGFGGPSRNSAASSSMGRPRKRAMAMGGAGGTPRKVKTTAPLGGANIEGRGSGGGTFNRHVEELCRSLVDQSTIEGLTFVCQICSARLSNSTSLRNHIRGTHLALKSVRCNVCGEAFKWAMQLLRHKRREHSALTEQFPPLVPAVDHSAGYSAGYSTEQPRQTPDKYC